MIRELTREEIPLVLEFGDEFITHFHGWLTTYDKAHVLKSWQTLYDLDMARLFGFWRDEVLKGCIGACVIPCFYTGQLICREFGWYVVPDERGSGAGIRLLLRMERWAKDRGAVRGTINKVVDPDNPVWEDYSSLGYRPREVCFGKVYQEVSHV